MITKRDYNSNIKAGTKDETKEPPEELKSATKRPLAFGYVRASTLYEVKQKSNERQKDVLRKTARERGIDLPEEYIFEDKALTGKNMNREAFSRMMKLAPEVHPDFLLITKIDRFARSLKDLLEKIQDLKSMGIDFVAAEQPGIDTSSPAGKLMLQILGAFAEFEVEMINSRTSAGREQARANGIRFGRPPLQIGKGKNARAIDRKVVLEKKSKGLSANAIAKDLGCSKTPILRILREERDLKTNLEKRWR